MRSALWAGMIFVCLQASAGEVRLTGRAVDENNAAVAGAQVSIRPVKAAGGALFQTIADPTGKFEFDLPGPGDYLITASREGFFRIDNRPLRAGEGANEVTLVLNPVRELFEKVDVSYSPPAIDFDHTASQDRLTGTQILEVPYPSTNTLRNAMRAIPGIVQDSRGGVHMNGGTEEQVLYTLDGFQVNDPLTGRFDTRLSVEAVQSMDATTMNPAEFGKGATGTLAIKTSTGDDKLRYSATNFVPSVESRKGIVLSGWTPRFNLSGPIRRGRAWFSDGLDLQYDKNVIEELPKGEDSSVAWRANNLLRTQINLAPSNILTTGFLVSFWRAPRNGLGALSPLETTANARSRQWFFNVKDQWYFARGALLEVGYAMNRTFDRELPQGQGFLIITPDGRRGNSFTTAEQRASRNQFLGNVFLPTFVFFGAHQLKTGIDLDALSYWQDASRTGFEYQREGGIPSRSVVFAGSGLLRRTNSEAASYVQDSWRLRPNLLVEAGIRQDWDRLIGGTTFAPRVGVSFAPPGTESTKISGGYGIIYEEANLQMFSRPFDQYALTTHYLPDGSFDSGPAATVFTFVPGKLRTPRYENWTAAVDHRFPADLVTRVEYIRRRGRDGLTYANTPVTPEIIARYGTTEFDAVYGLMNLRCDVYDAFEVTVRKTFRKQYEWLASYTRSRALSNAVVDINLDNPTVVTGNVGRMPWDSPNRVMSWGYLPTFWEKWAIAYLLDTRNGYPFSVQDEQGVLVGKLNNFRYPDFFELNLHAERRFVFRANRWAFRFGFNNITNHKNPNVVNNDTGSPHFMAFYGGQSRALNFRVRWLGKN